MITIFMLMATYNHNASSGGTLAHKTVQLLIDRGYKVVVITVGTVDSELIVQDEQLTVLNIPIGISSKSGLLLTRFGIIEDYLSKWSDNVIKYFENNQRPTEKDIVIATTVGELGTLHLGYEMKKRYGCKFVIHFHDPIKHAFVNGKKYGKYPLPYASREKYEEKYVLNADRIVTCCDTFLKYLIDKYPSIRTKSRNFYFGWIESPTVNIKNEKKDSKLIIAYGGIFGWPQGPEILAKAAKDIPDVKTVFIGNWEHYKPLRLLKYENMQLIPRMSHQDYLDFLINKVDIGFLSLSRSYFSACVPAKLYEYCNTCKPILAALPDGDAKDIIMNNEYGIAVNYNVSDLKKAIIAFKQNDRSTYRQKLESDREKWAFDNQMGGFAEFIIS